MNVQIEMEDKVYTLEYDRASVMEMEGMGYNAANPTDKLFTNFNLLIRGALLKHHRDLSKHTVDDIISYMEKEYGMIEIITVLSEMVNELFILEGKKKLKVNKGHRA